MASSPLPGKDSENLHLYAGRWIALVDRQIVGQGGTPDQALAAARATRYREKPEVVFVPFAKPFEFPPEFEKIQAALPENLTVYLVGGAVRDVLLGRQMHDMDFVLKGDVLGIARRLADSLGMAYFPLDQERNIARLVSIHADGSRLVIDFAAMRDGDLEIDLRSRDFTINAMALELRKPQNLIDPLGGANDLYAKRLIPCTSTSFADDPVRILRAIRLAAAFSLHIPSEARILIKSAVNLLPGSSIERLRDELIRILEGPQSASAIRALDILGVLPAILPELSALKALEQPPPHILDVWNHTLDVLNKLDELLQVLRLEYDPVDASNLILGLAVLRLGRFRNQISHHLVTSLTPERSLRPLLFLAALYHDAGKAHTKQVDDEGKTRFFNHDQVSARLAEKRGHTLRLSNAEIHRLGLIVQHHMRPLLLTQGVNQPTSRAIFRFFRDLGAVGVDVCLLSLADTLATYGHTLPQELWGNQLDVVRQLLEAWWERPQESVSPPVLLDGHDLMKAFSLQPGPNIGQLLEAVREAQAIGEVGTLDEALQYVGQILKDQGKISSK